MRKVLLVVTVGIVVSFILTSCATPATQSGHNILVSRVEVSRYGFDKTPGEFRLEVEAGQEVEITFVYGDGDLAQNNPHIISVPEYGIKTDILDQANPEVSVSFTAKETGEVAFECVLPSCVGHHNLHGEAEHEDEEHLEEEEHLEDEEHPH